MTKNKTILAFIKLKQKEKEIRKQLQEMTDETISVMKQELTDGEKTLQTALGKLTINERQTPVYKETKAYAEAIDRLEDIKEYQRNRGICEVKVSEYLST